jgi:hypothetical protein
LNAKLLACVLMGVLVVHLSVLVILSNLRSARTPPPKPVEPTFTTATTTFTDAHGEKVKVVSEFTVQTKFATPEELEKLPAPPLPPARDAAEPAKTSEPAATR